MAMNEIKQQMLLAKFADLFPQLDIKLPEKLEAPEKPEQTQQTTAYLTKAQEQALFDLAGMTEELLRLETANSKRMEQLLILQQKQIPRGIFYPLKTTVTTQPTTYNKSIIDTMPWFLCTIINYGPDAIYLTVFNDAGEGIVNRDTPIQPNEIIPLDFKTANIARIVMKAVSTTAVVQLYTLA